MIINNKVYINNRLQNLDETTQYVYQVKFHENILNREFFEDKSIKVVESINLDNNIGKFLMTPVKSSQFRTLKVVDSLHIQNVSPENDFVNCFPQKEGYNWNKYNFGPLVIPQKGVTVLLKIKTLALYKRIIKEYEENELEIKDSIIYINGNETQKYTFKMNYYFVMVDNRHYSKDSRYWGFLPEDHVIGKAWFIWLSLDPNKKGFKKIRWERMFRKVE